MRKMRDFFWFAFLFGMPAVVAVIGIRFLAHRQKENPGQHQSNVSGGHGSNSPMVKEPESYSEKTAAQQEAPSVRNDSLKTREKAPEAAAAKLETFSSVATQAPKKINSQGSGGVREQKMARSSTTETCEVAEYAVEPNELKGFSESESQKVTELFEDVKKRFTRWLSKAKKKIPASTFEAIERRIANTQLLMPPHTEEPDLNWRGVGIWVQGGDATRPQIRLGAGFKKFFQNQRLGRARFELSRLMAQGISTCELEETKSKNLWQSLADCLGVEENSSCPQGSYSEAGWAISTAIAFQVSPLICQIPGLVEEKVASCLKKSPFPKQENVLPHSAKHPPQPHPEGEKSI